jgi:hypothetical protein
MGAARQFSFWRIWEIRGINHEGAKARRKHQGKKKEKAGPRIDVNED